MAQRVISFHYTLTDPNGQVLDSSSGGEPLTFLEGLGQIIPGLEKQLKNLKVKDKQKISVPANEAYGPHKAEFVFEVPLDQLPAQGVKIGDNLRAGNENEEHILTVTGITPTHAILDGNHPLAKIDLTFDVEITEMRDATEEELAHGHAHGAHGHHH